MPAFSPLVINCRSSGSEITARTAYPPAGLPSLEETSPKDTSATPATATAHHFSRASKVLSSALLEETGNKDGRRFSGNRSGRVGSAGTASALKTGSEADTAAEEAIS